MRWFATAGPEERIRLRPGIGRSQSKALRHWAGHENVNDAIRQGDPELLELGLLALSLID
ncbi:MAG TPA: hypothetical protein VF715_05520 [Thermoleophilaceae bacterium]